VILGFLGYLLVWMIWTGAVKVAARAKDRAEGKKLKRVEQSAKTLERKHELQSKARGEQLVKHALDRAIDG
jgi:hypothetical protein